MEKYIIEITGQIDLSFNENSEDFKETLIEFEKSGHIGSTIEDLLKHVAFYVNRFGTDGMVEGVGYVGLNGIIPDKYPYSGIMVGEDYDEFDFNVR